MRLTTITHRLHTYLIVAMIALFLFAQGAVVSHQASVEKHTFNHHCELCLLDAEMHGASMVSPSVVPVFALCDPAFAPPVAVVWRTTAHAYAARAPPRLAA